MKYLAMLVLLVIVFSFPVLAQSNDVALFAVGQFTHPVQGFTFGILQGRSHLKTLLAWELSIAIGSETTAYQGSFRGCPAMQLFRAG